MSTVLVSTDLAEALPLSGTDGGAAPETRITGRVILADASLD
ncbi:MAG TPA: hypothetical protein VMW80_02545 [Candidatus Dormibacteraeota bacterium]|nr:hypothetical protein [Candidatus Dormibacteraeota bacterium]